MMTREEAIYILRNTAWLAPSLEPVDEAIDMAIEALEQTKWIPCSEKLPEDLSEVNVTWINLNPELYYAFAKGKPFTATAVYYKDKWYWYSATCTDYLAEYGKCDWNEVDDTIEIVAWMPLPKPWKGEEK